MEVSQTELPLDSPPRAPSSSSVPPLRPPSPRLPAGGRLGLPKAARHPPASLAFSPFPRFPVACACSPDVSWVLLLRRGGQLGRLVFPPLLSLPPLLSRLLLLPPGGFLANFQLRLGLTRLASEERPAKELGQAAQRGSDGELSLPSFAQQHAQQPSVARPAHLPALLPGPRSASRSAPRRPRPASLAAFPACLCLPFPRGRSPLLAGVVQTGRPVWLADSPLSAGC